MKKHLPTEASSSVILFEESVRHLLNTLSSKSVDVVIIASSRDTDADASRNSAPAYFPSMSFLYRSGELSHYEITSKLSPEYVAQDVAQMGFQSVDVQRTHHADPLGSLIDIDVYYKTQHAKDPELQDILCRLQEQLQHAAHRTQQYLTRTHLFTDSLWSQLLKLIKTPAFAHIDSSSANLPNVESNQSLVPQREVAKAIQSVISSTFRISCVVLEHYRDPSQWHESAKTSLQSVAPDIYARLVGILDELHSTITSQAKRFIHRHEKGIYLLYAPFAVRGTQMSLRFAFLSFHNTPLPRLLPESLYLLISRYIREELREARIRVLANVSQQALRNATSLPYRDIVTRFDWRDTLKEFCSQSFMMLLPVTNAFAMTLRLYEQSSASLVLYSNETDIHDAPKPQYERAKSIPLTSEDKSLNVRTFKSCKKHQYRTRPNQDHQQALNPYGAKSEICFPLYFKSHPVGTVNIEYALSEGYVAEVDYLAAVVSTIESYLEMLLDSNDKYWLMTQIQYEQNVHEVENAIDGLRASKKRRDSIRQLLSRRLGVDAVNISPLSALRASFDADLAKRLQPAGSGLPSSEISQIAQLIQFREIPSELARLAVPDYWSGLTSIVMSNLLSNYFKHCDWEKGATLSFYFCKHSSESRKRVQNCRTAHGGRKSSSLCNTQFEFVAECYGNTPFDSMTLGCGTVRPIYRGCETSSQPRKLSRGLLICGIIARHLGGFVHLGNRLERSNCRPVVQVVIPVPITHLPEKDSP